MIELVEKDLLARWCDTLSVNDVVHFEAEDLLGLYADEIVAADELAFELR